MRGVECTIRQASRDSVKITPDLLQSSSDFGLSYFQIKLSLFYKPWENYGAVHCGLRSPTTQRSTVDARRLALLFAYGLGLLLADLSLRAVTSEIRSAKGTNRQSQNVKETERIVWRDRKVQLDQTEVWFFFHRLVRLSVRHRSRLLLWCKCRGFESLPDPHAPLRGMSPRRERFFRRVCAFESLQPRCSGDFTQLSIFVTYKLLWTHQKVPLQDALNLFRPSLLKERNTQRTIINPCFWEIRFVSRQTGFDLDLLIMWLPF